MQYSAEQLARLYMAQPWGGKAANPYRQLLALINKELHDLQHRCYECERLYIPTVLAWPTTVPMHIGKYATWRRWNRGRVYYARRYLLCPYCGHRTVLRRPQEKAPVFTEEQIQLARELYEAEMPPREIAKLIPCSIGSVRNLVRRAGGTVRKRGELARPRIPHQELEEVRYWYEIVGLSQQEVADKLGVPRWIVSRRVRIGSMHRWGKTPTKRTAPKKRSRRRQTTSHAGGSGSREADAPIPLAA